jgi:hypothetical protein
MMAKDRRQTRMIAEGVVEVHGAAAGHHKNVSDAGRYKPLSDKVRDTRHLSVGWAGKKIWFCVI